MDMIDWCKTEKILNDKAIPKYYGMESEVRPMPVAALAPSDIFWIAMWSVFLEALNNSFIDTFLLIQWKYASALWSLSLPGL